MLFDNEHVNRTGGNMAGEECVGGARVRVCVVLVALVRGEGEETEGGLWVCRMCKACKISHFVVACFAVCVDCVCVCNPTSAPVRVHVDEDRSLGHLRV